jgi:hypothetical protein
MAEMGERSAAQSGVTTYTDKAIVFMSRHVVRSKLVTAGYNPFIFVIQVMGSAIASLGPVVFSQVLHRYAVSL